jgi:hypothetical protein
MVPTWDLVLLVFLGASLVYGFLMGREKVIVTMLGAYVGLVIANQWGAAAFSMINHQNAVINNEWMSGNLSVFVVKVVLFAAVLLLVALKGGLLSHSLGGGGLMGFAVQAGYSALNAALIASSVLNFLPEETRKQVVDGSLIAAPLVNLYAWWLILPLLFMLVASVVSKSE